jgi:hypothetical protein
LLPADPPLLGPYSTGAIVLAPKPAAAGQYSIKASATGYKSNVPIATDITIADQTVDVILSL